MEYSPKLKPEIIPIADSKHHVGVLAVGLILCVIAGSVGIDPLYLACLVLTCVAGIIIITIASHWECHQELELKGRHFALPFATFWCGLVGAKLGYLMGSLAVVVVLAGLLAISGMWQVKRSWKQYVRLLVSAFVSLGVLAGMLFAGLYRVGNSQTLDPGLGVGLEGLAYLVCGLTAALIWAGFEITGERQPASKTFTIIMLLIGVVGILLSLNETPQHAGIEGMLTGGGACILLSGALLIKTYEDSTDGDSSVQKPAEASSEAV